MRTSEAVETTGERRKSLKAVKPATGNPVSPVEKVLGHEIDFNVIERIFHLPMDWASAYSGRPDFSHSRSNRRGQFPVADEAPSEGWLGAHDVNDKMLAEEYRRGLRVGVRHSIASQGLGFLFSQGHDIVRK
jgi:hypothetical protein